MRAVASTQTDIIRFERVNEIINWIKQKNEARIVVDDKPHYLKMKQDGTLIAVEIGSPDSHVSCDIDPDDLPKLDVIGVWSERDADADYSRFGIEI